MDLDEMMDLVHEIEDEMNSYQDEPLKKIRKFIQQGRIEEFKSIFKERRHSDTADKIFFHYKNNDKVESTIDIPFISDEYIVVRSEMYSRNKKYHSENNDGKYHAVWIIGKDPDVGFFLHRLPWSHSFEKEDMDWNKNLILNKLGIDGHLKDQNTLDNGSWRIQGDVILEKSSYSEEEQKDKIRENVESKIKQEVAKEFDESLPENVEVAHSTIFKHTTVNYYISSDSTDELKELQKKLDISENKVREMQEEDDIKALHASRRKKYIKSIIKSRFKNKYENKLKNTDTEEKVNQLYKKKHQKELEEAQQVNVTVENSHNRSHGRMEQNISHAIIFSNAIQNGQEIKVPDKSELYLLHDEHENIQVTLPRGKYRIDTLEHHRRR